ncbi:glycosyltransferase [Gammaproteobacteria bacterium]|nr:glycosyltransferase [Gammaproteobacteria bacterium]MDC1277359.1 glycosyltransferase [Gammaproteobacteria bacterium]
MSANPSVSVVMPVYNAEQYLDQAIQSILDQTFTNFEFIIINDGSSDSSLEILRKYKEQDKRILLIDKKNGGIVEALNDGLSIAKGNFIARMDSDDIAHSVRLEKQIRVFDNNPEIDLVYTGTTLIDKNGAMVCDSWRPNLEKTLLNLKINTFIPHPTVMFKRNTVLNLGGYTKKRPHAEDLDLWLRMLDQGCKFFYLKKNLLYYRLNPNSVRANAHDNYWYKVATRVITSGYRLRVFKYYKYLSNKERFILLIKMIFPQSYFHRRLK